MLELKALTKEYRSKSGNSIAALKNVTLELPEKGLIFTYNCRIRILNHIIIWL